MCVSVNQISDVFFYYVPYIFFTCISIILALIGFIASAIHRYVAAGGDSSKPVDLDMCFNY